MKKSKQMSLKRVTVDLEHEMLRLSVFVDSLCWSTPANEWTWRLNCEVMQALCWKGRPRSCTVVAVAVSSIIVAWLCHLMAVAYTKDRASHSVSSCFFVFFHPCYEVHKEHFARTAKLSKARAPSGNCKTDLGELNCQPSRRWNKADEGVIRN